VSRKDEEQGSRLIAGVYMLSFRKTPCTFSIAAVLGKVTIAVFDSGYLYTAVYLQSGVSSSLHPTRR